MRTITNVDILGRMYIIKDGKLQLVDSVDNNIVYKSIKTPILHSYHNVIKTYGDYVIIGTMDITGLILHVYKSFQGVLLSVNEFYTNVPFTTYMWNNWYMWKGRLIYIKDSTMYTINVNTAKVTTKVLNLTDKHIQCIRFNRGGKSVPNLVINRDNILTICDVNGNNPIVLNKELAKVIRLCKNVYIDRIKSHIYIMIMDETSMFDTRYDIIINTVNKTYKLHKITGESDIIVIGNGKVTRKIKQIRGLDVVR